MRSRIAWGASLVVVSALGLGTALAQDALKSGLQVGEKAGAFNVQDITGPNKGQSLCYR